MSEGIYTEEFVSLSDEQRKILDGPEEEIEVQVHDTPLWQEPDPEEVEEAEAPKKKKDKGTITIIEHGEDLLPKSKREVKRPPMNVKEEIAKALEKGESVAGEDPELVEQVQKEVAKKQGRKQQVPPVTVFKQDVPAPTMTAPVPVPRRPKVVVNFKGTFGNVRSKYLDVYKEGVYLILVEDADAEFSYSPPESEDIIEVTVDNMKYDTLSPGISFDMGNQKIRTTVLLIVKGETG